jgi:Cu2+-exporting ATPase
MDTCSHCGTGFSPGTPDEKFCCRGCEFVHQMIHDEGFDQFYALKGDRLGQPVQDRPFRPTQLGWLDPLLTRAAEEARTEEKPAHATLHLSGLTCIGCVWLVEKLFLRHPGALRSNVFPATAEIELTWEPESDPITALAKELPNFGYALSPLDASRPRQRESRQLLTRLGLCGAFALNAMGFTLPRYLGMKDDFAFAHIFELIALLSATFSLLLGGTYFFRKSFASLRQRTLHIDLPISLGLLLAYAGSLTGWLLGAHELLYFDFVATFTFLMLGGRYLHLAAAEKAQSSLQGQSALPESIALNDGTQKTTRSLTSGDEFRLDPGECLPVASFLCSQDADFSLAWMTGEPEPQTFGLGRRVPSGALNLSQSPVTVRADEAFEDSLAAGLAHTTGREESSPLLGRILKIYLVAVLVLGTAGGVFWLQSGVVPALQVVLAVFVVSCPCALGVAIPLADRRAALSLQKRGVFVQNPALWSAFQRLRHLVLDKTGTLTLERPTLQNPTVLHALSPDTQNILSTLTGQSLHPLSRTLHESLAPLLTNKPLFPNTSVHETPGQGLSLEHDGHVWFLGKPRPADRLTASSGPATALYRGDELIAQFLFEETTRPEVLPALHALSKTWKLTPHILSGDRQERVTSLAHELGIDLHHAHGELTPEEKAALVRTLPGTLYLGDGANDSLAFDEAAVSGSPAADRSLLDRKADFLFTHPGLGFLPALIQTAQWRHRTVRRILAFAITYNLVAVSLCLAGHMSPLLAAVLMPLSSLASLALASAPIAVRKAPISPQAKASEPPLPRILNEKAAV